MHQKIGRDCNKPLYFIFLVRTGLTKDILNSLPEPIKTDVMNTFDVYFEEGVKKGVEKGRAEGRTQGIEEGKEEIVRNLITSNQFAAAQISNLAAV